MPMISATRLTARSIRPSPSSGSRSSWLREASAMRPASSPAGGPPGECVRASSFPSAEPVTGSMVYVPSQQIRPPRVCPDDARHGRVATTRSRRTGTESGPPAARRPYWMAAITEAVNSSPATSDVHVDRRGAEHLEGQDAGLAARHPQLDAVEVLRLDDGAHVVGDVAKADLAETEHLQTGVRLERSVELPAEVAVEDLRDRIAVGEQEGDVEHRPLGIELHRIRADWNHVELTGADLLHVHDLVAQGAAVEELDRHRVAHLRLQRIAERSQHVLRGGTGGALDREPQLECLGLSLPDAEQQQENSGAQPVSEDILHCFAAGDPTVGDSEKPAVDGRRCSRRGRRRSGCRGCASARSGAASTGTRTRGSTGSSTSAWDRPRRDVRRSIPRRGGAGSPGLRRV